MSDRPPGDLGPEGVDAGLRRPRLARGLRPRSTLARSGPTGVANVPRLLLEWRETPGRLSRTSDVYGIDQFTSCKAFFLFEHFLKRRSDYVLWGFGATGRSLRRALESLGARAPHIVDVHLGRIGQSIHGARVISPKTLPEPGKVKLVASVAGRQPRDGRLRVRRLNRPG